MNRCLFAAALAIALAGGCGREASPPARRPEAARPTAEVTTRFASRLASAYAARDAAAAAALYAGDASAVRVGEEAGNATGRAAIERELSRELGRYRDLRLVIGRVWVGRDASVIEHVLSGTRSGGERGVAFERPVGVVGAFVVRFDRAGRVTSQRHYLDQLTLLGQVDRTLLPDGMVVRPVVREAPEGSAVLVAGGTAAEARNRAVSARVWAALSAHRVDDALAPMADDYLYVDFAAPAPLDRAATRAMVAGFLEAVPDLRFADPPLVIAAGDDVVTEVVEHATRHGSPITLHAVDVRRLSGGQITREWQYSNYREVMSQLAQSTGKPPSGTEEAHTQSFWQAKGPTPSTAVQANSPSHAASVEAAQSDSSWQDAVH